MLLRLLERLSEPDRDALVRDGIVMRAPERGNYAAWREAAESGTDHLKPFQPSWPAEHLTRASYDRRLALFDRERARRAGFAWHAFDEEREVFVGTCRLSSVRYGSAMSGTLGYWTARDETGRGVATAMVRAACDFAFSTLDLQRVTAAHLPENAASARVLEKAGFRREGLARSYLEIDGLRRDHVLAARLQGDPEPSC